MRHWIWPLFCAAILFNIVTQRDADGGDPAKLKVVNLDKLNTDADEEDPFPTPDGNSLLYVVTAKGNSDILISKRSSATASFPAGKAFMAEKTVDERSPFMHKDKLYFASNEVKDPKFVKLKNLDIFSRIGTQAPLFVPGDVNSPVDEMYPWITPAGKELYFSRKTDDGWKLFQANGPTPGPIGKSQPVGFPVGFHRATIVGPGTTMYLQGPLEGGKIGIFKSKRAKVGERWGMPEEVKVLNHPESKKGDMQPALSADGSRLYFVSDRPGGKGGLDIWVVNTAQLK